MKNKCKHTEDIKSIKRSSLVIVSSFKKFDKVTLYYDNYLLKKLVWKLRVRVNEISCIAFREAIKESVNN